MKDYSNYKAVDFFFDEDFILFVKKDTRIWNDFTPSDDDLTKEMEIAAVWIKSLHKGKTENREGVKAEIWQSITRETAQGRVVSWNKRPWVRLAAACFIGVVLAAASYIIYDQQHHIKIQTAYGQRQHIMLPDSSSIELFGHSSIKYGKEWGAAQKREIWLTNGDAQFSIQHTTVTNETHTADPFKVHYGHYTVTVLGTKFFISTRNGLFKVHLLEGKVRISDDHTPDVAQVLLPGESFEANLQTAQTQSYKTGPTLNQDWDRSELSLDGKSVSDVLDFIQNVFGYEVKCNSPEILNIKLNGKLPSQNLDQILLALGKMTDAAIEKNNSTIIIQSKN